MAARVPRPTPPIFAVRRPGRAPLAVTRRGRRAACVAAASVSLAARVGSAQAPERVPAAAQPASAPATAFVADAPVPAAPVPAAPARTPITSAMRWTAYRRQVGGPQLVVRTAVGAGFDQWGDRPAAWPQGATGYARRAASWAGRAVVQHSLEAGTAAALRRDPRIRPSGAAGVAPRVAHAFLESVTDRTRDGRRVFPVSVLVGAVGATAAQSAWEPPGGVDGRFVARRALTAVAFRALVHVAREFQPRRPGTR